MLTMRFKKLVLGVSILAAPAFAMAQSAEELIDRYTPLAGSSANAKALVNGLRTGNEFVMVYTPAVQTSGLVPTMAPAAPGGGSPGLVMLPPPPPPPSVIEVRCTPPAGLKLGFGNVEHALRLGQRSLENYNIFTGNPQPPKVVVTPEHVCVALVGGNLNILPAASPVALPGVLQLRAQGLGWPEVAKRLEVAF